ncbi:NAD(P)H-quinone oxidoreductase [Benzoatithermus flavus]|uniref:NAD(P)H-quinone oxidoreductase n=1 Tax=Benzoatithermus flavus TaxID=3108223 RepID=A0ABU8XNH5_9PROT
MTAAIPAEMTYIRIDRFGPPEALVPDRMPVPRPGHGEVLIKVAAAGVNRPDVLQRQGGYPPPPGASEVPGLEVAGEIAAVGEGVERWRTGDRVMALVTGGGYAEYCLAPAPQVLPVPHGISLIEAGGIPETFFTVWTNVFDRGRLQPGESFLVHGGSSGIGTTAIQLARELGAIVYATVGSVDKQRACEALGARRAINHREEDFVEVVKAETGGKGVDVILDMVGGPYVERNLQALAVEGRLVQIAWLQGAKVQANFAPLMLKRLTWTGSTLRARSVEQKGAIARVLEEKVWPLLAAGKVKPLVHATFPLEAAAAAHALMESSSHIGKIVLTTRFAG